MKTKNLILFLLIFCFSYYKSAAQSVNIADNTNFIVNKNTSIVIPKDLNVGKGSSGSFNFKGVSLKVNGTFYLNYGAVFAYSNGTLNFNALSLNTNSTFKYTGNNQTVLNFNYGNLIFEGTGTMLFSSSLSNPTTCNNLTIDNSGNVVKIPDNKALTVNGTLTNDAQDTCLVVASNSSGDGSLIFNSNNVPGEVQRYCSGHQWHYIASPISNATVSMLNSKTIYSWDASQAWNGLDDSNPWSLFTGTLGIANGYAYYADNDVINFKGLLNASDYSVSLLKKSTGNDDYDGWNFVGNPYTAAIDWDAAVADGAVPEGAENAIYFFDDDNGTGAQSNYRYYVPSTGGTYGIGTENATKYIPVGQGFFIKTNTNNVTLYLKPSYRVHNTQSFYKAQQNNICRIKISGNNLSDETVLRIVEGSKLSFDPNYDARKLFTSNKNYPQIYTLDSSKTQHIAINSIPKIKNTMLIPLGIKATAGDYSISFSELSIYAKEMYLLDKKTGTKTNLNYKNSYNFHFNGGINNDRFEIIFSNAELTNIDNNSSQQINIYPNPTKGIFYINNINDFNEIKIIDPTGKIITQKPINNYNQSFDITNYANGLYIIKLIGSNKYTTKSIIKN